MGDFYCIKNKNHNMTDEDCVREVLIPRTKKGGASLCSMCKVKGRIAREHPTLVRKVLSNMLGEKAADDFLVRKGAATKNALLKSDTTGVAVKEIFPWAGKQKKNSLRIGARRHIRLLRSLR